MSSTPASTAGWLATMPTVRPSRRAKQVTMFCAASGWISRKRPSSTTFWMTCLMSYDRVGSTGTSVSRAASSRSIRSLVGTIGGSSALFDGR